MKLVIFGASGATGKHLVQQALEKEHEVTAFVRNPDKLKLRQERLTVVEGNVNTYAKVEEAINGKEAVISALGANSPFKYDPIVVTGMAHILTAMKATGVGRLIYLSFAGVRESRKAAGFLIHHIVPYLINPEIRGHEQREKMIRSSGLRWTIVQAPTLTNGPLTKSYRSGEQISSHSFFTGLSRADVAHFMLRQLQDDSFTGKAVRIIP